jgi:hypothetical protein
VVLFSPESLNLLVDLFELMCLLLPLDSDLIGLLLSRLLQLGQVSHQPVVLLLVELQLLLLSLRRTLLLLQLHCILMHGITIQEFLIAAQTDGTPTFSGRVVLGVGAGLRETGRAIQGTAKLTIR